MLHGKATIQLINAKTNKIEKEIVEENMITNAYKNLLNPDFPLDVWTGMGQRVHPLDIYTPVYKKCFGGILVFSKTMTEDANNILPVANDVENFLGSAGSEYAGNSKFRGSLNSSESQAITNGYKYVWDFATNELNGEIKSVCLTSENGGNAGLVRDTADISTDTSVFSSYANDPYGTIPCVYGGYNGLSIIPFSKSGRDGFIIGFIDNKTMVCVRQDDDNKIYHIEKVVINDNIGIMETINKYNDFTDVNLSDFGGLTITPYTVTANYELQKPIRLYMDNTYLYSITRSYNYTTKISTINLVKIQLSDMTISSQSTFDIVINDDDLGNNGSGNDQAKDTNVWIDNFIYISNWKNNRMYVINVTEKTFITYNLDNPNYIPVKFSDMILLFQKYTNGGQSHFYILANNKLYDNVTYYRWGENVCKIITNNSILKYPICFNIAETGSYNDSSYTHNIVFNPFLSSINNLTTPIIKYNTQTLKIIYEITDYQ